MNGVKMFKKFLVPGGLYSAIPAIKSKSKEEPAAISNEATESKLIRPSQLPIYSFEPVHSNNESQESCVRCPGVVEQQIGTIRKSVTDFVGQFTHYTTGVKNIINTGTEHSRVTLDYLREETSMWPRIGAVGLGGLSGIVLGLRGGKIKKLIYSSTGALVVASLCYPRQAQEGVTLANHYVNIGYNFLYGVKPGEATQIKWPQLPKIPTNFSEITDLAGKAAESAVSAVGTLFSKASQAYHDFSETPIPANEKEKKDK